MKPVIGCLDSLLNDNFLGLLSADFRFVTAQAFIRDGQVETNCDALWFNGTDTPSQATLAPFGALPVLGMSRLSKFEQHMIFRRLGIACPAFYHTNSNNKAVLAALLADIADETLVVVKSGFGARGLQQFLTTKKTLVQEAADGFAVKKAQPTKVKLRKEAYPDDDDTDTIPALGNSKSSDLSMVASGGDYQDRVEAGTSRWHQSSLDDWLITVKVAIKREFRILSFAHGVQLICERHATIDHFQNNLSVGAEVTYLGREYTTLAPEYEAAIKDFAAALHAEHPTVPVFSMDVWVDAQDRVGMFEYATEFGFRALDFGDVRTEAVRAINFILAKQGVLA